MNLNQSFIRKITYVAGIALLLFPLFSLGQPATTKRAGGKLSQLRDEYSLSQAQLGEIDPVSEAVKLATLGMRGIAVVVMWDKAIEYKKTEDFDKLKASLDQLTKLAPNFLTFWEFQAHNLSYNSSIEFDDYRDRYRWVKKGIEFLIQGTRYNRNQARLLHQVGWYFGHKLGKSDERLQFRALFRVDEDFHKYLGDYIRLDDALGPGAQPDNWLVARQWFIQAEEAHDGGARLGGRLTPLMLFAQRGRALINFAGSLQEEGRFDDESQAAYARAYEDWVAYGNREVPTPFGHNIVLNDLAKLRREMASYRIKIVEFDKSLPEKIRKEKRETVLSKEHRQALDTPERVRTETQNAFAADAEELLKISASELAQRVPAEFQEQAKRLAELAEMKQTMVMRVESAYDRVNYEYWRLRCQVEQTDEAIRARQLVKEATRLMRSADLKKAKAKFEEAWDVWDEIFKKHRRLERDLTAAELMESIRYYVRVLEQLELEIPKDFKLSRLLEMHELDPNFTPGGVKRIYESPNK